METPSTLNLHEWRKQGRHLRSQLQFLEPLWTDREKELGEQTQKLLHLLGEDHDLAVLRETLAADPLEFGGHRVLKEIFAIIDPRRADLQRQAFVLGRKLYKDPAKVFADRFEGYWKAWAGGAEPAKSPAKNRPAKAKAPGAASGGRMPASKRVA